MMTLFYKLIKIFDKLFKSLDVLFLLLYHHVLLANYLLKQIDHELYFNRLKP